MHRVLEYLPTHASAELKVYPRNRLLILKDYLLKDYLLKLSVTKEKKPNSETPNTLPSSTNTPNPSSLLILYSTLFQAFIDAKRNILGKPRHQLLYFRLRGTENGFDDIDGETEKVGDLRYPWIFVREGSNEHNCLTPQILFEVDCTAREQG